MNPEVCLCSVIVSLNLLFNILNSWIKNYLLLKKNANACPYLQISSHNFYTSIFRQKIHRDLIKRLPYVTISTYHEHLHVHISFSRTGWLWRSPQPFLEPLYALWACHPPSRLLHQDWIQNTQSRPHAPGYAKAQYVLHGKKPTRRYGRCDLLHYRQQSKKYHLRISHQKWIPPSRMACRLYTSSASVRSTVWPSKNYVGQRNEPNAWSFCTCCQNWLSRSRNSNSAYHQSPKWSKDNGYPPGMHNMQLKLLPALLCQIRI